MRASELIKHLEELIQRHGDRYMTYIDEDSCEGMENVEEIEFVPHHETNYFCIK